MVINETLSTPVLGKYDAVVVGGGPADCGAAIALGRSGMKTLLIEKFNCLDGAFPAHEKRWHPTVSQETVHRWVKMQGTISQKPSKRMFRSSM